MPPPSPLLLPHQPAAAAAAMNLDHHLGPPPPRRRDDADHLHLLLPSPDDLIPLHQSLITPDLALAFDIPAPSPPPAAAAALPEPSPDEQARTLKRPRLVWTPQLHKRFVDAVLHLGIKNAVPKTIMQLMSVDGLTRENVASHLQKYRLYLKRMQGMSHGAPSAPADALTEQLFATVPVPPRFLARDQFPPFLQVGNLPRHHHHHLHPSYYHPQQQVGSPPAASFEFGFARHHQQQGGEKKALPLFPNSP